MNDLIGGRYQIERKLGAGGMGSVYEATDAQGGGRVAVKVVTAEVAKNEVLLRRFEREVRAACGLDTPHVVRAIDAGRDEYSGLPYLVMEVLEGEDVRSLFKRLGPLPLNLAVRIVAQACRGLEVAHAQGIVHRDIKPANLFLALNGSKPGQRTIKILDFGIAKLAPDASSMAEMGEVTSLTQTGSMLGSPLYMAPEQARGQKNIDGSVDLWALGVVLYQAITGVTPHQDSGALGDLIIAICTEPAPPVYERAPWVSPAITSFLERALSLHPNQRFRTAAEMYAALLALLPPGDDAAIRESDLVPLPPAERAHLARQRQQQQPSGPATISEAPPAPAAPSGTMAEPPTTRWPGLAQQIAAETPAVMQLGTPSTAPGAEPVEAAKKPGSRAAAIAAAAAVAMALGGSAAFFGVRSSSGEPKAAGEGTSAEVVAAPPTPSAATAADAPDASASDAAIAEETAEPKAAPETSAKPAPSVVGSPPPRGTIRAGGAVTKPPPKNDIYLGR